MSDPKETPTGAAEALKAVQKSRAALNAQYGRDGWRYTLAYAALAGAMVGAQGLAFPLGVVGTCTATALLAALYAGWSRRTGVRMTGLTPKRARWVALGVGLTLGTLMISALALQRAGHAWPFVPILAVIGAVLAGAGSSLWWRVYRAESEGVR